MPYQLQHKHVKLLHDFIQTRLDAIVHEIDLEQQQDKEIEDAYKAAQRAENMVKYKSEIMSRPKKEWHVGNNQKKELQKESKKDLANIKSKFDDHAIGTGQRKREQKREQKQAEAALKNGGSLFAADAERKNDKKDKSKKQKFEGDEVEVGTKRVFKDAKTDAYEKNKWRGKRNSIGAKMAKFKGGNKNFRRSGGGIGDRDLSGKSSK